MICPTCEGRKALSGFVTRRGATDDGPPDCNFENSIPCFACHSSGEVDDDFGARLEAGEKMRTERVARGVTLAEASRVLGITPSQLSDVEHGRMTLEQAKAPA